MSVLQWNLKKIGLVLRILHPLFAVPPEPPQIENARSVIAVILDHPTNITCRANGGKPAATITWLKGGLMVTDHVFTSAVPQADGKRMDAISSLTISPSKSDSGKQVACHAMNEAMVDPYTTSAILDVQCKFSRSNFLLNFLKYYLVLALFIARASNRRS